MRRGKDDEKIIGPMFPRLHVYDTEKGGPRAPPRNKMALYEQLSTPSHRFNRGVFPLNPSKASNLVPPTSTSQGSSIERNLLIPHHIPSSNATPSHLDKKLHSQQLEDGNSNSLSSQLEQRKKVGDEDDFTVPVFAHFSMEKIQNGSDREKPFPFSPTHLVCSTKVKNAGDNDKKNNSSRDTNVRQNSKNQNEERLEVCFSSKDHLVRSSTSFIARGDIAGPGTSSLYQQNDLPVANFSRFCNNDVCLQREPTALPQPNDSGHCKGIPELAREIEKRNIPGPITVSDSYSGGDLCGCGEPQVGSEHQEKTCRSLQFGNGDKSDDVSETSMVDSITTLDITPDDVVVIIGQKRFWKARRAIVKIHWCGVPGSVLFWHVCMFKGPRWQLVDHLAAGRWTVLTEVLYSSQQRLFAAQVFELHRLIKVQRLIAASPHLFLENGTCVGKHSLKTSPAKKLPSEYVVMPPVHVSMCKDDGDKPNHKRERYAENAVGKASFSSVKNGIQPSNCAPYLGNPIPVPMAADSKMGPWCFHPSLRNQWLIPVMSPSEGLVYKPYAAPGFMGSVCGGCGPFGAIPLNGNFINACCGVPEYHLHGTGVQPGFPPVGHSYFPPYGMPVMTPPISGSAVEQMNYIAGSGFQGHTGQLYGAGANFNLQHQSSCNLQTQKRGSMSRATKPQASRDSEIPGSTVSSPSERVQGFGTGEAAEGRDALQLFPVAPATPEGAPQPLETGQPARVIKVVPHKARSATESAARIFQSIQEERKR